MVLLAVYMPGATFIAPGFVLYIFTNAGIYNFVVPTGITVTVDVLIVAGGGGGGASYGKGGLFKMVFSTNNFVYIQLAVVAGAHCSVLLVK